MNFKNLSKVVYSNQLVLTTEQIAQFYECETRNISENFKNNEEHFIEGIHYFKLKGEDLKNFRLQSKIIGLTISSMTRWLYLWTKQGTIHHCKIINSNHAWAILELLEENYFSDSFFARLRELSKNISEKNLKCVYAFEMENGTVKIGYTQNVRKRMQTIMTSSGLDIVNAYCTEFFDSEIAYCIEQACHETFDAWRVRGEFFKISFADACAELEKYSKIISAENQKNCLQQVTL